MRDRLACGFAFDARADEETGKAMRFGKLTVLTARMNPDLAMAEELLKKTRSGNLFTVFGQPDIDIRAVTGGVADSVAGGAGELQVEIHGLDVYDPTTGVVPPIGHSRTSTAGSVGGLPGAALMPGGHEADQPDDDPAGRDRPGDGLRPQPHRQPGRQLIDPGGEGCRSDDREWSERVEGHALAEPAVQRRAPRSRQSARRAWQTGEPTERAEHRAAIQWAGGDQPGDKDGEAGEAPIGDRVGPRAARPQLVTQNSAPLERQAVGIVQGAHRDADEVDDRPDPAAAESD